MKPASKTLLIAVAGAAMLLAGCAHKPVRPTPDQTALGPEGGAGATGAALNPTEGSINPELQPRSDLNWDANHQIRGAVESVYFDFDRSNIKPGERAKVQAAKDYLDKHPTVRMLLEGHCDWRGTAEYNLALGDRRASEVKKYLIALGVSPDRLDTLSKGSEDATKNADETTMAHDRRVDFVVIPGAGDAGDMGAAAQGPATDNGAAPAPAAAPADAGPPPTAP